MAQKRLELSKVSRQILNFIRKCEGKECTFEMLEKAFVDISLYLISTVVVYLKRRGFVQIVVPEMYGSIVIKAVK